MVEVVGVDHLVVSVGDFEKSKKFYAPLMEFLGFGVDTEYEGMMGWANGNTLFWIAAADEEGKKHKYRKGDIGFHHYAFRLRNRKDVDGLQAYLEENGATILDPAGEYYDDYYAVFFLDPDGMKLEGMRWGTPRAGCAQTRRQETSPREEACFVHEENRSPQGAPLSLCAALLAGEKVRLIGTSAVPRPFGPLRPHFSDSPLGRGRLAPG